MEGARETLIASLHKSLNINDLGGGAPLSHRQSVTYDFLGVVFP